METATQRFEEFRSKYEEFLKAMMDDAQRLGVNLMVFGEILVAENEVPLPDDVPVGATPYLSLNLVYADGEKTSPVFDAGHYVTSSQLFSRKAAMVTLHFISDMHQAFDAGQTQPKKAQPQRRIMVVPPKNGMVM